MRKCLKVLKVDRAKAKRLEERLLRKGLVVGFAEEEEINNPLLSKADVVLVVKDERREDKRREAERGIPEKTKGA